MTELAARPGAVPALLPEPDAARWSMWRYRSLLPLADGPIRYPLPVGGTPLHAPAPLRERTGMPRLWLKDETWGPSASNKDRATALVIENGLRSGATTITTSSTGSAAVATATGAAATGMHAVIFVGDGCAPAKLAQMRALGATVFRVAEGYRAAVRLSRRAAEEFGWLDRNTGVNPLTLEAKKTVALETWEQLGGRMPDVVVAPVGDGPTIVALGMGFRELHELGLSGSVPRLVGVQATGCQPLVHAFGGSGGPAPPLRGTVAGGIDVPEPAIGDRALDEVARSGGTFVAVPDEAMLECTGHLAGLAGVGAEPAGAAGLAGLYAARREGTVGREETVVVLVTGRELATDGVPACGAEFAVSEDDPALWERLAEVDAGGPVRPAAPA